MRTVAEFIVETEESVRGTYRVRAESEEAAKQMFGNPQIHEDAEQIDYMAYEVDVRSVSEQPEARRYMDGGEPGGTCPCGKRDPGIKPEGGCWCTEDGK